LNTDIKPATPSQRKALGKALLSRLIPADLTEDEAAVYLEKIDEITAPSATAALKIVRPPVMIKVIAQFTLGEQPFEAVLTRQQDGRSILVKEAIRHADTDGLVVRTDADGQFIYKYRFALPPVLNDYCLATAWPHPFKSYCVLALIPYRDSWTNVWLHLGHFGQWGGSRVVLVLRRRTVS
jgi:hypothetical protein